MSKTTNIDDREYIEELERWVCFLAGCYDKAEKTFVRDHLEKCSISNPNRRPLTECERLELARFPRMQGARLQKVVSDFAKSGKDTPKEIDAVECRFLKGVKDGTNL